MFMSSTASTRRAKSSHEFWQPHPYQTRGVEFLSNQNSAALFLDPGMGKTSIVLAAFAELADAGIAKKMLVVAPLRVVQTVWSDEARKWTQFRHLRFSTLHGPKKADRLKDDADIWLINPEGCQWLSDQYFGRSLPFDTVVIDELTKFKNAKSVRSKSLRPRLKNVRRRWGLTGTPIPNGYLDLFGQFLMLDDGAALGKYVTHYRDTYFQPDFTGFDYSLQPGGAARVEARIAPYVLRMAAEDYLDLPPLIDDVRNVDLEPAAKATYAAMKKDMLAELPEGVVTGANAAAVYSKLKQMANGAVYLGEGAERKVSHLHDTKLDAMTDLVEELCGAPLLVAYEFNHDLDRLKARLGEKTPHIGAGVSTKQTQEIVNDWNAGEIPVLLAHPASAGHGLNLQGSGASHIAWLGPIWDLELYEQFIQRVHRQGTTSQRIVNHIFVARDTIDELVVDALRDKSVTQDRLLANLNTELQTQEPKMPAEVRKLSRQGQGGAVAEAERPRIVPKGWGKPATSEPEQDEAGPGVGRAKGAASDVIEQRAAVTRKITQRTDEDAGEPEREPASERAKAMFSKGIQERLEGAGGGVQERDYAGEKLPPGVRRDPPEDVEAKPEPKKTRAPRNTVDQANVTHAVEAGPSNAWLRERAVQMAMEVARGRGGIESVDDFLADAQKIVDFLTATA